MTILYTVTVISYISILVFLLMLIYRLNFKVVINQVN